MLRGPRPARRGSPAVDQQYDRPARRVPGQPFARGCRTFGLSRPHRASPAKCGPGGIGALVRVTQHVAGLAESLGRRDGVPVGSNPNRLAVIAESAGLKAKWMGEAAIPPTLPHTAHTAHTANTVFEVGALGSRCREGSNWGTNDRCNTGFHKCRKREVIQPGGLRNFFCSGGSLQAHFAG